MFKDTQAYRKCHRKFHLNLDPGNFPLNMNSPQKNAQKLSYMDMPSEEKLYINPNFVNKKIKNKISNKK